jgi:hypothetical protein
VVAVVRRRRARRRVRPEVASLDGSLFDEFDELSRRVAALSGRVDTVEGAGRKMIQRVGVVRFNPFPDTGGNQSFVVALLDAQGDGVVLSSLHARGGTRIYLKQVAAARAETALSDEETEAINRARAS